MNKIINGGGGGEGKEYCYGFFYRAARSPVKVRFTVGYNADGKAAYSLFTVYKDGRIVIQTEIQY